MEIIRSFYISCVGDSGSMQKHGRYVLPDPPQPNMEVNTARKAHPNYAAGTCDMLSLNQTMEANYLFFIILNPSSFFFSFVFSLYQKGRRVRGKAARQSHPIHGLQCVAKKTSIHTVVVWQSETASCSEMAERARWCQSQIFIFLFFVPAQWC